ncbi:MAG: hypothetical protein ACOYB3_01520 [Azonexus sp.]
MKVFVQMPTDTPFKTGDIYLERGYRIVVADDGKAVHEDIGDVFLRPASTDLIEGTDQAKVLELSARLKNLAKEVESL